MMAIPGVKESTGFFIKYLYPSLTMAPQAASRQDVIVFFDRQYLTAHEAGKAGYQGDTQGYHDIDEATPQEGGDYQS
jgi:squalene cyclase